MCNYLIKNRQPNQASIQAGQNLYKKHQTYTTRTQQKRDVMKSL